MLKVDDLRGLSVEELKEKETAFRKELMQLRFQAKTGKLEQKNVLGEKKRDIARILTVINEMREQVVSQAKPAAKKTVEAPKEAKPAKKAAVKVSKATSKAKEEPKSKKKVKS